jgi:RNA polymerase sigma-70 factor (ECF subfamily)
MDEHRWLNERFEAHRDHLRGVAYRMLGSLTEAEDAVQEAWLHLNRAGADGVENLGGWLTTVVARVCLDMLRSRRARSEEPLDAHAPGALESRHEAIDPEEEALLADSVGLALLVVLEKLPPAERLAFVLHDIFAVPFDEIAPLVGRTTVAAKKLASRARQRVQGGPATLEADLAPHREVVSAFLAAARGGDLQALLAVLDPDVVRRADRAAIPANVATEVRGAYAVAKETAGNKERARFAEPAIVDGGVGLVVAPRGQLQLALRFAIRSGRIAEIEVVADPARLAQMQVGVLPR